MSYGLTTPWTRDKTTSSFRKTLVILCVVVVVGVFLIVSYCNITSSTDFSIYRYRARRVDNQKLFQELKFSRQDGQFLQKSSVIFQSGNILKVNYTQPKRKDASSNVEEGDKKGEHIPSRSGLAMAVENVAVAVENDIKNTRKTELGTKDDLGPGQLETKTSETEFRAYEYNVNRVLDDDDFDFDNITDTDDDDDDYKEIDWNDARLNILQMPKIQFDKRFKNPCWFEPLASPTPYKNNSIKLYSPSAKKTLNKLTQIFESMFEDIINPIRLRCLPYFLIIGQPKCGSTDLFWKIVKHPDIEHPTIKELHWWTRSRQGRRFSYRKLIPFVDYVDMFDRPALEIQTRLNNITELEKSHDSPPQKEQIITGEASVSLFWDNNDWMKFPENINQTEPLYVIPHYIHHFIPDVKLIVMFREPVERLYSDYLYFHSDNKSADDFHNSVTRAIQLYKSCIDTRGPRACVYDTSLSTKVRVRIRVGLYSVYLKDWLNVFPRSQFFILRLEDYSADQIQYLRQIYTFLGQRQLTVEQEDVLLDHKKSNVRKVSDQVLGDMHDETRKLLRDFYRPFNIDLATMLQDKRFLWTDT